MSIAEAVPIPFACEVLPDRERVIVRPVGELDLSTIGEVDRALLDLRTAGFDRLIVDLRDVTFMDSSGLHLLLRWSRLAASDDIVLDVVEAPPEILRVVERAGVGDALAIRPARRTGRFSSRWPGP